MGMGRILSSTNQFPMIGPPLPLLKHAVIGSILAAGMIVMAALFAIAPPHEVDVAGIEKAASDIGRDAPQVSSFSDTTQASAAMPLTARS